VAVAEGWMGVGVTGLGVGELAAMVRMIASAVMAAWVSTVAESFFVASSLAEDLHAPNSKESAKSKVKKRGIFFKGIPPLPTLQLLSIT
jgi:hypothetical protein